MCVVQERAFLGGVGDHNSSRTSSLLIPTHLGLESQCNNIVVISLLFWAGEVDLRVLFTCFDCSNNEVGWVC